MATKTDGRFMDDAESLEAIIQNLPDKVRDEYTGYGARALESVFPNRQLVVYTLSGGSPVDVITLRCGSLEMTPRDGPVTTLADELGLINVGVAPVKWRGRNVFLHIPQNFIFKWKGKTTETRGVQFAPHYAILIKTRSKEHLQIDGDTYCVTLNKFRERFPEVPIRY